MQHLKRNERKGTMGKIILTILIIVMFMGPAPAHSKIIFEIKTGPETETRDDALNLFDLTSETYYQQALISSLSAGLLIGNFLGITVEGTARSPEYINNRMEGTIFEKSYVNLFLDLLFIRAGVGADLETIEDDARNIQAFAGLIMKLSRSFGIILQATAYGNYTYPDRIDSSTFTENIVIQGGFSFMIGGKKKEKRNDLNNLANDDSRNYWQQRLQQEIAAEKARLEALESANK